MYHLTKNGTKGYCRAIVRECPLGGESAFFKKMNIPGVARPSAPQARETGTYDDVYGKEKSRQDRIKERQAEREAERQANGGDTNKSNDNDYTPEYKEKLVNVQKEITEFNEKYADYLNNSSGNYFMANQKLSYRDEEYLSDLDKVGESVSSLANDKVNQDPQILKDREEYDKEMNKLNENRQSYVDEYNKRTEQLTAEYRSKNLIYVEYARSFNAENARFKKGIKPYNKAIEEVRESYGVKYESTYGKAYKEALVDSGVEFADGEEMFSKKVYNQHSVNDSFANDVKSAMDYYPEEWVSNIDSKLTVHEYSGNGNTLGFVRHSQGVRYKYNDKRVELFSSNHSTTVHEFGHVVEINNPEVGRAERLFLIQEKQKSSFKKVKKNSPTQNIATDSLVREYSGVYYSGGSSKNDNYDGNTYEIFTTGVENLFAADSGGFTTGDDCKSPQHRNFILGLFATKVRK